MIAALPVAFHNGSAILLVLGHNLAEGRVGFTAVRTLEIHIHPGKGNDHRR